MKAFILLFLVSVLSFAAFSQTYTGSLAATDPTFNRPDPGTPPTVLSSVGTNVYYDVISFVVNTPGLFSVTSNSPMDNFGVLYGPAGFNPASPLTNALVANDDLSGAGISFGFGFIYDFAVAGTYSIVVTSFKNGALGPYEVTITPAAVVPVNLVSFTAEKADQSSNVVKWSNANEVNVDKYQLQLSADGKKFYDVQNAVTTARNNSAVASYSYTVSNPEAGINFYRIKIVEKNGAISLSPVAAVNNKGSRIAYIKVFPNPAVDYLFIETKSGQVGKASVSVINAAGAIVYTKNYVLNNQSILTVDVRKLSTGKYFVKTVINKEENMVTFLKN